MSWAVADTGCDSLPSVAVPVAVGVPVMVLPVTVADIVRDGDWRLQAPDPQPVSTPREIAFGVQESTVAFTVDPVTEPRNWQVTPLIVTGVAGRVPPLCVSTTVALRVMLLPRARARLPAQPPPWTSSDDALRTAVQVPATSAGVDVSDVTGVGLTGERRLKGEKLPASQPVSKQSVERQRAEPQSQSSLPCRPRIGLHTGFRPLASDPIAARGNRRSASGASRLAARAMAGE